VPFICPACQQIGEIDLHTLDRHPNAAAKSLIERNGKAQPSDLVLKCD